MLYISPLKNWYILVNIYHRKNEKAAPLTDSQNKRFYIDPSKQKRFYINGKKNMCRPSLGQALRRWAEKAKLRRFWVISNKRPKLWVEWAVFHVARYLDYFSSPKKIAMLLHEKNIQDWNTRPQYL